MSTIMLHDAENHRTCRELVDLLNATHRWNLSETALQAYCNFAESCRMHTSNLPVALLEQRVINYHADHQQVAAIQDEGNPGHAKALFDVRETVTRILASKTARSHLPDDGQGGLDDLVQDVLAIVWRKINTFAYKSKLNTWLYTIAVHQFLQVVKARNTQKRALGNETFSLEEQIEAGATPPEAPEPTPDVQVLEGQLWALIHQVLARHSNERLLVVFQLSHTEQQTLREIGASLSLSAARIYGLLQQAIMILREDPSLRAWFGKDDGPHISA